MRWRNKPYLDTLRGVERVFSSKVQREKRLINEVIPVTAYEAETTLT